MPRRHSVRINGLKEHPGLFRVTKRGTFPNRHAGYPTDCPCGQRKNASCRCELAIIFITSTLTCRHELATQTAPTYPPPALGGGPVSITTPTTYALKNTLGLPDTFARADGKEGSATAGQYRENRHCPAVGDAAVSERWTVYTRELTADVAHISQFSVLTPIVSLGDTPVRAGAICAARSGRKQGPWRHRIS